MKLLIGFMQSTVKTSEGETWKSNPMRLNEKKCKDMVINVLNYQPTVITSIQLNGIVIDRVSSYKLLSVIISDDLSWNEHCDSIH